MTISTLQPVARHVSIALLSIFVVSACATTDSSRSQARINIQEEVGFTITEDVRVSGNVRADYERALKLLEQGQTEQGIAILETIVAAEPELSAPHIDLGIAYHRAGDLEAAESSLLRALETNPEHPITHNELGIVYRESGRFADARASYEAALAFYPNYHYARRNLAILCDLYLADLECALENYEAYIATAPDDQEASIWIADTRNRLER